MSEKEEAMVHSSKLLADNMQSFVELLLGSVESNNSSLNELKLAIKSIKSTLGKEQYAEIMDMYKRYTHTIKLENKALNSASKAFSDLSDAFTEDVELRTELNNKIRAVIEQKSKKK